MLNTISGLETAAEAHAPFGMGAALPSGVRATQLAASWSARVGSAAARPLAASWSARSRTGAVHRRAFWAADVIGRSRMAAQLNVALGQRNSGEQYPHTTRVGAKSGDAEGPHTAREPV